ncbi:MAG: AAA family ATPase [Rhizobacter sp.]
MSRTPLSFSADDIDLAAYMQDTDVSYRVKPASAWEADLNAEFCDQGQGSVYPRLPWARLDNKIAMRPGEVTLWFGFNGHGKSLLLGQAVLSLCAQGQHACVASFEMRPHKTLARMARQFIDESQPSPPQVRAFLRWAQGRLWLYDQTGSVDAERVFAVIRYAATELKVSYFVVDNLTKCVASDDDYAGQKAIVDKLTALAQSLNIHIHLVHHARKDRDECRPPRKMDALGASAITNLVDNVLIVWRNKAKAEAALPDYRQPDALLICDKQRHGTGWEGSLNLNFHQRSMQYVESGSCALDLSAYPHGLHAEAAAA